MERSSGRRNQSSRNAITSCRRGGSDRPGWDRTGVPRETARGSCRRLTQLRCHTQYSRHNLDSTEGTSETGARPGVGHAGLRLLYSSQEARVQATKGAGMRIVKIETGDLVRALATLGLA